MSKHPCHGVRCSTARCQFFASYDERLTLIYQTQSDHLPISLAVIVHADIGQVSLRGAARAVESAGHTHMIAAMLGYSLYTLLAIGLAILLTAVFRRLRRDDQRIAPPEEDAAFERRIRAIEADYSKPPAKPGE